MLRSIIGKSTFATAFFPSVLGFMFFEEINGEVPEW